MTNTVSSHTVRSLDDSRGYLERSAIPWKLFALPLEATVASDHVELFGEETTKRHLLRRRELSAALLSYDALVCSHLTHKRETIKGIAEPPRKILEVTSLRGSPKKDQEATFIDFNQFVKEFCTIEWYAKPTGLPRSGTISQDDLDTLQKELDKYSYLCQPSKIQRPTTACFVEEGDIPPSAAHLWLPSALTHQDILGTAAPHLYQMTLMMRTALASLKKISALDRLPEKHAHFWFLKGKKKRFAHAGMETLLEEDTLRRAYRHTFIFATAMSTFVDNLYGMAARYNHITLNKNFRGDIADRLLNKPETRDIGTFLNESFHNHSEGSRFQEFRNMLDHNIFSDPGLQLRTPTQQQDGLYLLTCVGTDPSTKNSLFDNMLWNYKYILFESSEAIKIMIEK